MSNEEDAWTELLVHVSNTIGSSNSSHLQYLLGLNATDFASFVLQANLVSFKQAEDMVAADVTFYKLLPIAFKKGEEWASQLVLLQWVRKQIIAPIITCANHEMECASCHPLEPCSQCHTSATVSSIWYVCNQCKHYLCLPCFAREAILIEHKPLSTIIKMLLEDLVVSDFEAKTLTRFNVRNLAQLAALQASDYYLMGLHSVLLPARVEEWCKSKASGEAEPSCWLTPIHRLNQGQELSAIELPKYLPLAKEPLFDMLVHVNQLQNQELVTYCKHVALPRLSPSVLARVLAASAICSQEESQCIAAFQLKFPELQLYTAEALEEIGITNAQAQHDIIAWVKECSMVPKNLDSVQLAQYLVECKLISQKEADALVLFGMKFPQLRACTSDALEEMGIVHSPQQRQRLLAWLGSAWEGGDVAISSNPADMTPAQLCAALRKDQVIEQAEASQLETLGLNFAQLHIAAAAKPQSLGDNSKESWARIATWVDGQQVAWLNSLSAIEFANVLLDKSVFENQAEADAFAQLNLTFPMLAKKVSDGGAGNRAELERLGLHKRSMQNRLLLYTRTRNDVLISILDCIGSKKDWERAEALVNRLGNELFTLAITMGTVPLATIEQILFYYELEDQTELLHLLILGNHVLEARAVIPFANLEVSSRLRDGAALHLACQVPRVNPELIDALLAGGARVLAENQAGLNALHVAMQNMQPGVIFARLVAAAAKEEEQPPRHRLCLLAMAISSTNNEYLDILLQGGGNNFCGMEQHHVCVARALCLAVGRRSTPVSIVETLLNHSPGAAIHARNEFGHTPIQICMRTTGQTPAMAHTLICHGADASGVNPRALAEGMAQELAVWAIGRTLLLFQTSAAIEAHVWLPSDLARMLKRFLS